MTLPFARPAPTLYSATGLLTKDRLMQFVLYHLTTLAVLAVFVVLLLGLRAMMQGKSPNLSQKLMRWRVGLQFMAVVIIVAYAVIAY